MFGTGLCGLPPASSKKLPLGASTKEIANAQNKHEQTTCHMVSIVETLDCFVLLNLTVVSLTELNRGSWTLKT